MKRKWEKKEQKRMEGVQKTQECNSKFYFIKIDHLLFSLNMSFYILISSL